MHSKPVVRILGAGRQPVTGNASERDTAPLPSADLRLAEAEHQLTTLHDELAALHRRLAALSGYAARTDRAVTRLEAWVYLPWWQKLTAWIKGQPYA